MPKKISSKTKNKKRKNIKLGIFFASLFAATIIVPAACVSAKIPSSGEQNVRLGISAQYNNNEITPNATVVDNEDVNTITFSLTNLPSMFPKKDLKVEWYVNGKLLNSSDETTFDLNPINNYANGRKINVQADIKCGGIFHSNAEFPFYLLPPESTVIP